MRHQEIHQDMGVGRGGAGEPFPLDFENFSKKNCFLSFEWEKTNFTTSSPPLKNFWTNPLVTPLEKILRYLTSSANFVHLRRSGKLVWHVAILPNFVFSLILMRKVSRTKKFLNVIMFNPFTFPALIQTLCFITDSN